MLQDVCMENNILLQTSVLGTQLAFCTLCNSYCCYYASIAVGFGKVWITCVMPH